MLMETAARIGLRETLRSKEEFHPFPDYQDRRSWDAAACEVKAFYIKEAEALLHKEWPVLRASLYREFAENGNRSRFEEVYFQRRTALRMLILGECFEGKGRFLKELFDVAYLICEESSWVIPAHNTQQDGRESGLPDYGPEGFYIDLFSAETAAYLAYLLHFFGGELDRIDPDCTRRIRYELSRRICVPFLERDDMWWMGLVKDRRINNWNPWIVSNVLSVFLLTGEQKRVEGVLKCLECLDRFIDSYPPDGGCDEGPSYWTAAGAALYDALELLDLATGGSLNVYSEPLIQNMGRYILNAHISGDNYVNFADCPKKFTVPYSLIRRWGLNGKDEALAGFGEAGLSREDFSDSGRFEFFRAIRDALGWEKAPAPLPFPDVKQAWLCDREFFLAREDKCGGLCLAAKGGHNAESHNHNDVGSFIVYLGEEPVIVDAGVGEYTKKTFSEERYTIWTMQSSYHNLPEIGGKMQLPGTQFAASQAACSLTENEATLSLELKNAYPADAGISSWKRFLSLHRLEGRITLQDTFCLEAPQMAAMHFMVKTKPRMIKEGQMELDAGESGALLLRYPEELRAEILEIPFAGDARLAGSWGQDSLYRIRLETKAPVVCGEWNFTVSRN